MVEPTELDAAAAQGRIAVVGGGPAGMTAALLLARAGRSVVLYERSQGLGGLWASRHDDQGRFLSDNSCKVYQPGYRTAPALLESIGLCAEDHFVPRYDLTDHWLRPFVRDSDLADLAALAGAFFGDLTGLRPRHDVSVAEWLDEGQVSEGCRGWMRATALGGIAGTLRMTIWELGYRIRSNVDAILAGAKGPLHWNARPPNGPGGFVTAWTDALVAAGVELRLGEAVRRVDPKPSGGVRVETKRGVDHVQVALLALPPPGLARVMNDSSERLPLAFGLSRGAMAEYLRVSRYEHLGITWLFDQPFASDLPLGGHNVREGWHPILVQHDQYAGHLPEGAVTAVVCSVAVDTALRHPRLGTLASDHSLEELASILWEDERRRDPSLPEPLSHHIHGLSSATQITGVGPLPMRGAGTDVLLATNLHGLAPYFTASLEAAVQAGAIAAQAVEPHIQRLPMGSSRTPWTSAAPVRKLELETELPCSAEQAWALFADTPGWSRWSRYVLALRGELSPGQRWTVSVQGAEDRRPTTLRPRLLSVDPGRSLLFATTIGGPAWLRMEHGFVFEPRGPGRCVLRQPFAVSGRLSKPLWWKIRPTLAEFEAVGTDLAAYLAAQPAVPRESAQAL